jgi:hypothetical protein
MDYLHEIQTRLTAQNAFQLRDDAFALIIGLGGTGCYYAGLTKALFTGRYGEETIAKKMDFYFLDTSENERPDNSKDAEWFKMTGLPRENNWINGWLSPELRDRKDLVDDGPGGGGVRQIGRWKLFAASPHIIRHLDEIITKYRMQIVQRGIKKINVFIMASICGGTGCGTFIDIPYFVRKAVENNGMNENLFDFYGMLELPDSIIDATSNLDDRRKKKALANTYAALKDLYYFMGNNPDYTAQFQGYDRPFVSSRRVFDFCFLLSNNAMTLEGQVFNRNPLDNSGIRYLNGAIPEAVNIIMSTPIVEMKEGQKPAGKKYFDLNSYIDNFKADNYRIQNGKGFYGSTFGVSRIEIPLAQMIAAIFNRIFLGLSSRWDLIKDEELIVSVLRDDLMPVFKLEETFGLLCDSLNIHGLTESELVADNLIRNINNKIQILIERDDYKKKKKEIFDGLERVIDSTYKRYGPFLTLKILEQDMYGAYLNYILGKVKPESFSGNISVKINNYKNFKNPLGLKTKKKEEERKELLNQLEAYIRPRVFNVLKEQVQKWIEDIEKQYHHGLFTRITEMLTDLTGILKRITGIETLVDDLQAPGGSIFSWDFSGVSYEKIAQKISFLFVKKITRSDTSRPVYTKERLFIVKDGMPSDKEIFSLPLNRNNRGITVQNGGARLENVIGIEEMIQFNSVEDDAISMETMLNTFLANIKNQTDKPVFTIMLDSFGGIINRVSRVGFQNMIILSSPDVDLSKPLEVQLDDLGRQRLFQSAIENFRNFALPSLPVFSGRVAEALNNRRYAVTLEPEFEAAYSTILSGARNGIISRNETQKIIRERLSMMVSVNFYFDYSFDSYYRIRQCKEEYDTMLASEKGEPGFHIAEGPVEDIRPKLEEIV